MVKNLIQKNDVPRYRIGDYAKYMGVTPDFLKHYEQYRLVSYESGANGYRYYPFGQSCRILECLRLRGYGLSIHDMDVLLNDKDADSVMEKLDARADEIERQILLQQAVIAEQRALSRWHARMRGKRFDWRVETSEDMLFLPHTSQKNFLEDERIYDVLGDYIALMPMVKSCMQVHLGASGQPLPPAQTDYAWGLTLPAAQAERFALPVTDVLERLPARKTLYLDFSDYVVPENHRGPAAPYTQLLQKLDQLGLTPCGDMLITLLMHTHMSGQTVHYGTFAVPIE